MNASKTQQGFTLIELVIVIVILGILAATALPRFMNVTEQAHTAAVEGAGGGFGAAVTLARAQWVANGANTADPAGIDNIVGFGLGTVDVTTGGWPAGVVGDTNTIATDDDCVEIWNGVMQNPPVVDTSGASIAGAAYEADNDVANECLYTYQPSPNRSIRYSSATGAITVDSSNP